MSKNFKLDCADPEIRKELYDSCKKEAKTDLDNMLCELIPFAEDCNLPEELKPKLRKEM